MTSSIVNIFFAQLGLLAALHGPQPSRAPVAQPSRQAMVCQQLHTGPTDTIILRLSNGKTATIITSEGLSLSTLGQYDLNTMVQQLDSSLTRLGSTPQQQQLHMLLRRNRQVADSLRHAAQAGIPPGSSTQAIDLGVGKRGGMGRTVLSPTGDTITTSRRYVTGSRGYVKETIITQTPQGRTETVTVYPSRDNDDVEDEDDKDERDPRYRKPQHSHQHQVWLRNSQGTYIAKSMGPDRRVEVFAPNALNQGSWAQLDTIEKDGVTTQTLVIVQGGNADAALRLLERPHHSDTRITISKKPKRRTTQRFDINLGLNTYLEKGESGVNSNAPYALKPIGSRYISFRALNQTKLGDLEKSRIYALYGLEVAWNNYMYSDDVRIEKNADGQTVWTPAPAGLGGYQKSKLTVATLNLPLMLYYQKPRSVRGGLGGFVGYRLDSYSKIKYSEEGKTRKDRDKSNYNLNDFQYGLRAQVGFREVDIFCNYHLNSLFKAGDGNPELNTISFGIEF